MSDVLMCSSLQSKGLKEIWDFIIKFIKNQKKNKNFYKNRESQKNKWMWNSVSGICVLTNLLPKDLINKEKFILRIQENVKN